MNCISRALLLAGMGLASGISKAEGSRGSVPLLSPPSCELRGSHGDSFHEGCSSRHQFFLGYTAWVGDCFLLL